MPMLSVGLAWIDRVPVVNTAADGIPLDELVAHVRDNEPQRGNQRIKARAEKSMADVDQKS